LPDQEFFLTETKESWFIISVVCSKFNSPQKSAAYILFKSQIDIVDFIIGGVVAEEKNELFSQKVRAGIRTYFFDVKQSKENSLYLVISESKPVSGEFQHHRVMIFEEDFEAFIEGIDKTIDFIRKNQKQKSFNLEKIRQQYPKAYTKWSSEDDELLQNKYDEGISIAELSQFFQRQPSAIRSRLEKLAVKKTN
jgi:hypothetical protein